MLDESNVTCVTAESATGAARRGNARMTKADAVKWLNNLKNDIGDARHSDLWHYAEAIDDAISVLSECEEIVHCKGCSYFEPVWGDELLGRCTQAKAWYEERGIWDYCSNNKITETAEPQPDGIQFRTVDDLGRICIPKYIREKLGVKPGTECAVYSTDELTFEQIIVIRRKNKK